MAFDPENEVDQVRFLVGDLDDPPLIPPEEVLWYLEQAGGSVMLAAALAAEALAARHVESVDLKFETIDVKASRFHANYLALARKLRAQARAEGALGLPLAGGISRAEVATVRSSPGRRKAFFRDNLFNNPPPANE